MRRASSVTNKIMGVSIMDIFHQRMKGPISFLGPPQAKTIVRSKYIIICISPASRPVCVYLYYSITRLIDTYIHTHIQTHLAYATKLPRRSRLKHFVKPKITRFKVIAGCLYWASRSKKAHNAKVPLDEVGIM